MLSEYIQENSDTYPMNIGSENMLSRDAKLTLAFFLADRYLLNFESSHCVPLPKSFFREPWSEKNIKKFSF